MASSQSRLSALVDLHLTLLHPCAAAKSSAADGVTNVNIKRFSIFGEW